MKTRVPERSRGSGARWIACLALLFLIPACKGQPVIEDGSSVRLHYTLTVDGKTVDSSRQAEPLAFQVGSGQIIPGLEAQLKGLKAGDKKTIVVQPDAGYGPVYPQAIQKVPRAKFQRAGKIEVGSTVTAQGPGGRTIHARVTDVTKDTVTVDMNHPLAGKTLNFDVEVVDVTRPGKVAGNPPAGPSNGNG
jgi:FKBP-type peptidyl-prolyl cis-trans isomerase 2